MLDWDRDYRLFSVIADVRNDGSMQHLPGVPKGLPWGPHGILTAPTYDECSYQFARELKGDDYTTAPGEPIDGGDCHSHSWMTRAEVGEAIDLYRSQTSAESDDLLMADLIMMVAEIQHPGEPTRVLFCFDN